MLDKMDPDKVSEAAEAWEKVIRKLRTGDMPPAGMPRPDTTTYNELASHLEVALDRAAVATPNPGRPGVHRLNRAEYTNAIRDLLDLNIDGEALLPADDSSFGFDNNADNLSISPMLLDRYLVVAGRISRLAIGDPKIRPAVTVYDIPKFRLQNDRASEDLPFGSHGGLSIRYNFPLDGEYYVRMRLQKYERSSVIRGLEEPHQLDVRLDGRRLKLFTIGGERDKDRKPEDLEAELEVRFPAKAGPGILGVTFPDDSIAPEGMLRPPQVSFHLSGASPISDSEGEPAVASVSVSGPYNPGTAGETASRRRVFVCEPQAANEEEPCAKRVLSTLAHGAYRRPATDLEIQRLLSLYRTGRSDGFEAGIEMALQGILISRQFLFRIERDPGTVPPDTAYAINDLDLASRLSFFLWSSIPDAQLLDVAERGKLRDNAVLEQQVRRMLLDPRSKALVDNFFGQWLYLRSMRSAAPDEYAFPDFDENLRAAFEQEMSLFCESMLQEDHSVLDLLSANYTFVNERLARHYGIPNVYGNRFRRIALTDASRLGLLGKGSVLTVTSYPDRTSPVLRGKWILENILGTPPPPPPPNVPALKDSEDVQGLTMRQRMEQHRSNPACASCHSRMDPLGFVLENFDAIGRWRNTEVSDLNPNGLAHTGTNIIGNAIDVSGVLADGTKFHGPAELRKILLSHREQFVATVTEKLLTYALGRGLEFYDEPAIRSIISEAEPDNYRWSSLIVRIVESTPFRMRRSAGPTNSALLR
jgi:hypothetical protein